MSRLLLSLFLSFAATSLRATEFAVEPFDGPAGTSLAGSGTGWLADSSWSAAAGFVYEPGLNFVALGSGSLGVF